MLVINIGFNLSGVTSLSKYLQDHGFRIQEQLINEQLEDGKFSSSPTFVNSLWQLDPAAKYGIKFNKDYKYYCDLIDKMRSGSGYLIFTLRNVNSLITSMFRHRVGDVNIMEYIHQHRPIGFSNLIKELKDQYWEIIEEIKQLGDKIIWFNMDQLDQSLTELNSKLGLSLTRFPRLNMGRIKIVSILAVVDTLELGKILTFYQKNQFQLEVLALVSDSAKMQFDQEIKTGYLHLLPDLGTFKYAARGHLYYLLNSADNLLDYLTLASIFKSHMVYWNENQMVVDKINYVDCWDSSGHIDLVSSLNILTTYLPVTLVTDKKHHSHSLIPQEQFENAKLLSDCLTDSNSPNCILVLEITETKWNSIIQQAIWEKIPVIFVKQCADAVDVWGKQRIDGTDVILIDRIERLYSHFLSKYHIVCHLKSPVRVSISEIINLLTLNHRMDYLTNERGDFLILKSSLKTLSHPWEYQTNLFGSSALSGASGLSGLSGQYADFPNIKPIGDHTWILWGNPNKKINSLIGEKEMQLRENLYAFVQEIIQQLKSVQISVQAVCDGMMNIAPNSIIITFGLNCYNAQIPINDTCLYVIIRPDESFNLKRFPVKQTVVLAKNKKTAYPTLLITDSFHVSGLCNMLSQLN